MEEKEIKEEVKEVKKENKKVTSKEYDKLMEQFEKAMATAAHHQNLSKYYQNEYEKALRYRSQDCIEALLPTLDSFELAFKGEPSSVEAKNYRAGFEYIYKMFLNSLINQGLYILDPKENDEFDSSYMQIVDTVETDDTKLVNKVQSVLLKGYKLVDRLIRPASVKVYVEKKTEEVKEETEENKQ